MIAHTPHYVLLLRVASITTTAVAASLPVQLQHVSGKQGQRHCSLVVVSMLLSCSSSLLDALADLQSNSGQWFNGPSSWVTQPVTRLTAALHGLQCPFAQRALGQAFVRPGGRNSIAPTPAEFWTPPALTGPSTVSAGGREGGSRARMLESSMGIPKAFGHRGVQCTARYCTHQCC